METISFPSIMAGKKIMYIHGFGSSAQSGTVKRIRETLPMATVVAYDMPLYPADALDLLHEKCAADKPDLIIGTSMGGMYAEMLYGYDRLLINPAFEMGDTMREHNMMGMQQYQNPRADGVQEFLVTKSLVKEYKDVTARCFSHVTEAEQPRVWGLFGDADELVHTWPLFCQHYRQAAHFHGGHRMDDKSFLHGVLPVIRWMDDRQEGRQRPIVYIAWETLADSYGHPLSSLHKAFEMLIATYQVYIVCPAPTNDHAFLTAAQTWIEQYLSTPAHDHVVFTNQRALLYGDYLVASHPDPDFVGAGVEFGSDELKTWEDIIVYFERLGGQ